MRAASFFLIIALRKSRKYELILTARARARASATEIFS